MYECIRPDDWREYSLFDLALWKNGLAFKNIDFANPSLTCAVERRCVPAGANPARQLSLQPEAVGAVRGGNELD